MSQPLTGLELNVVNNFFLYTILKNTKCKKNILILLSNSTDISAAFVNTVCLH